MDVTIPEPKMQKNGIMTFRGMWHCDCGTEKFEDKLYLCLQLFYLRTVELSYRECDLTPLKI